MRSDADWFLLDHDEVKKIISGERRESILDLKGRRVLRVGDVIELREGRFRPLEKPTPVENGLTARVTLTRVEGPDGSLEAHELYAVKWEPPA